RLPRIISIVLLALVLASLGHFFASGSAGEPPLPVLAMVAPPAVLAQNLPPAPLADSVSPVGVSVPEAIATPAGPVYEPYPSYIYIPTHAEERQPLQVVLALHGMGGEGKAFGANMIKEAERNGWLLVAPTINYGDWHNPDVVAGEEI